MHSTNSMLDSNPIKKGVPMLRKIKRMDKEAPWYIDLLAIAILGFMGYAMMIGVFCI